MDRQDASGCTWQRTARSATPACSTRPSGRITCRLCCRRVGEIVDINGSAAVEVMSTRATRRSGSSRTSSATLRRQKPHEPSKRRIGRRGTFVSCGTLMPEVYAETQAACGVAAPSPSPRPNGGTTARSKFDNWSTVVFASAARNIHATASSHADGGRAFG